MYKKLLFIVLSCALAIGFSHAITKKWPLTIITEDWPPYNYEKNGEVKGFSVEIVQAIMEELYVSYPIQILPGARGEIMLDEGPHVMIFSLFRTPERENRYKWIGPISEEAIYFYKKKGSSLVIKTLEDAKKVERIACMHQGLVFTALQKEGFTNLDGTPMHESIIRKLEAERVDLSVNVTPLGVTYLLRRADLPIDALEQTPVKLLGFPLYIACTKDIPNIQIKQWQEALDRVKASGTYTKIYNKYLGK